MRVDVAGVGRAGLEDVDPEAVEFEPPAAPRSKARSWRTRRRADPACASGGEDAGPRRQVVQRGVGGVAAVAVRLAPGAAGLILGRQHAAGVRQLGVEGRESRLGGQGGLIELGREERADRLVRGRRLSAISLDLSRA